MKKRHHLNRCQFAGAALIAAVAVWQARADYPGSIQALGPLGYWRFNDPPNSPPLNQVANLSPLGSIANGFVVGTVNKGEPGVVGTCLRFVGTGGTGDDKAKVDVPYNPALNPTPPFSIEFWAKPNSLGSDANGFCPLSNFDPSLYTGGNRSGWLFYVNNTGRWNFRLGNTGGYAGSIVSTNGNAQVGVWQHIVATYDGTNASIYANGVLVGSGAAPVANWVNNSESFLRMGGTPLTGNDSIGAPWAINSGGISGNRGFDGWLDEVAIYPTKLSPSTIMAHYQAATINNAGYSAQILADGPSAYWGLNEPVVTPPDPSTFPPVAALGSVGTAGDGTNLWGALAGQSGPGYAGFGANSGATFFDGVNGSCPVSDVPALHFSGNITLAAWINPAEKDYYRDIIAHGWDPTTYAETFLRISRGPGSAGYGDGNYYEIGASDGTWYDSATMAIPAGDVGNWVFLAGTFDGTKWNLYRNGVLVSSLTTLSDGDGGALNVTNRWWIGGRSDPSQFDGVRFSGSISEASIFNKALTPLQINALYNAAQVPPVITTALRNPGTVYQGSSLSLSVWAEGSPTLSYSWLSNGVPVGVTTANLTLNNLQPGTDTIAVVVTNPYGTTTNAVTFSVVAAPPFITQQPAPTTRFVGYPFSLSVTAGGTAPLTYFWMLNGTLVQAGLSSTYSGVASLANAGGYSVLVSNLTGITVMSTTNALTVNPIPSGYGGAVIGSRPMAYWRLGESSGTVAHDGIGGNDGTYHSATLGVPGYSTIDADTAASFSGLNSYAGGISGTAINFPGHSSFSLEAWVNAPPGQADQATVIAKGIGANGTTETEQFSIDVSGGVYRFFTSSGTAAILSAVGSSGPNGTWQHLVGVYDDAGSTMYLYVNGQLEATHPTRTAGLVNTTTPVSIGSKRTGNDPNYDGTFNGTIDEVAVYPTALDPATIYNHYAAAYGTTLKPFILIQPAPLTNYFNLPAKLSVSAAGSVPLSYQWKFNGVDIPGATDSAFTNSAVALSDAGNYSVGVSNSLGGVLSAPAHLTVWPTPTNAVTIPGLVVHIPFDNNLIDATGRGNNGVNYHVLPGSTNTFNANPGNVDCYFTPGVLGSAFHYTTHAHNLTSSTAAADETYYVSLGVRPDLQFSSNVNFSVAFWIRLPLGYQGGDLPFFTDAVNAENNPGFVFAPAYGYGTASPNPTTKPQNYGGWAYSLFDSAAVGALVYGDLGSINDSQWHHLAYVINRNGASSQVYLDGVLAHSTTSAGTYAGAAANIDTGKAATIGQDPTGFYPEDGSADIDDLGVWRRGLSALEVASIYAAAAPGLTGNVGYSFVGTSSVPPVSISLPPGSPTSVRLTWSYGTLQSATSVTGPYTDVAGAGSPYTVTNPSGNVFYRIRL